jgi:DNA adenine methylase
VGGKFFMLDVILKLIPKHEVYVEVFGGSAKVLLNKPLSPIEIFFVGKLRYNKTGG